MVLEEWGTKIRDVLKSLTQSKVLDEKVIKKVVSDLAMVMIKSDVEIGLVKQLQTRILEYALNPKMAAGQNRRKIIHQVIVKELLTLLTPAREAFLPVHNKCNVLMMVGLQGAGKTTSCCKLALFYRKKGWRVALVCADTFRAGALDQLRQNAIKARIPYYGTSTETDPTVVATAGVAQFRAERYEIIIVDTSGRHMQHAALLAEMQSLVQAISPQEVLFVQDATNGGGVAREQVTAFHKAVNIGSVILTKLDGHAKGGGVMSAVVATRSPIAFVGTGEHLDDWEAFRAQSFVSRLLGLGDLHGLMELFEDSKVLENNVSSQQLVEKMMKSESKMTYRDIREQCEMVRKLGPIDQILSKIPGMSLVLGDRSTVDAQAERKRSAENMNRWFVIMDSMTQQELDSTHAIFVQQPGRVDRLARGAGVTREHVEVMIEGMRKMAVQMKKQLAQLRAADLPDDDGDDGGRDVKRGHANLLTGKSARQQKKQNEQARKINELFSQMGGGNRTAPPPDTENIMRMMSDMKVGRAQTMLKSTVGSKGASARPENVAGAMDKNQLKAITQMMSPDMLKEFGTEEDIDDMLGEIAQRNEPLVANKQLAADALREYQQSRQAAMGHRAPKAKKK